MAIATSVPYTLLSLDRYARIMGINPAHFNQAIGGSTYLPIKNSCSDLWFQTAWINADSVGREDLAREIHNAETDIARELGYWPGPKWIEQEVRDFPRHYRRDVYRLGGGDVRGQGAAIKTAWGKLIQPGQRAVVLMGTPTVAGGGIVYSDEDGDGFAETATVTLVTSLTDVRQVKVYFAGNSGAQEYEIRPERTKAIAAGVFTATFWVWQLIDPDLWNAIPTVEGAAAIDISDTSNLVVSVEVYREFTDFAQASATLYWEPHPYSTLFQDPCGCGGIGCPACEYTTQCGCLHIRDFDRGFVVTQAATYDADSAQWQSAALTYQRDPDFVKIYYYAGEQSQQYLNGISRDKLSDEWANAIAWMATARLERPFCHCGALTALATKLQTDLSMTNADMSFSLPFSLLDNPFGTRRGEVMAWQRVSNHRDRLVGVGLA